MLTNCAAHPGACGFPDAASTGAHGTLAPYTGPLRITTAGTVIADVTINGCVRVDAINVTFRNVRIACGPGPGFYLLDNGVVRGGNDAYDVGTTTLDHVTFDCLGSGATAVGEARITATALDIGGGCENGFDIDRQVSVTDSYIHNLTQSGSFDSDGIQVWPGAGNVVWRHNTVLTCCGDNSAMITGRPDGTHPQINLTIDNNLMTGGNYTVYCQGNTGSLTNNRFGPLASSGATPFGYTSECAGLARSGNVLDTTGALIPLSQLE